MNFTALSKNDILLGGIEIVFTCLPTLMYNIRCTPTFCEAPFIANWLSSTMCQIEKKMTAIDVGIRAGIYSRHNPLPSIPTGRILPNAAAA